MNRSGFAVMMDTILFLTVIILALAVTIQFFPNETGDLKDPDSFLSDLSDMEVRLSDFTDIEDDSLVRFTDVLAYTVLHGSEASEYLSDLLDRIYGTSRYRLDITFQERTVSVGAGKPYFMEKAIRGYSVSTGGNVYVCLSLV